MQIGHQNKLIQFTALILGVVMVLLIVNRALFVHTHINANGEVIVHSHPFKKSGQNDATSHHHSNAQFHYLDNLSLLFPILFLIIALVNPFVRKDFYLTNVSVNFSPFLIMHKGREPPFLFNLTH